MIENQIRVALKKRYADVSVVVQAEVKAGTMAISWVLAMAHQEATDALLKLTTADPEDPKAIRELQNTIQRQVDLVGWLNKAVLTGKEAWSELEAEQRNDIEDAVLAGLQEED